MCTLVCVSSSDKPTCFLHMLPLDRLVPVGCTAPPIDHFHTRVAGTAQAMDVPHSFFCLVCVCVCVCVCVRVCVRACVRACVMG